jgi:hypothetical protein
MLYMPSRETVHCRALSTASFAFRRGKAARFLGRWPHGEPEARRALDRRGHDAHSADRERTERRHPLEVARTARYAVLEDGAGHSDGDEPGRDFLAFDLDEQVVAAPPGQISMAVAVLRSVGGG